MELQNGIENRIRGLDKNVWEYCIMEEKDLNTFISKVNQLKSSPDTFDTELKRIQTDFDKYVNNLGFLKTLQKPKLIKDFKNAVKNTENQIKIEKLTKYINDYRSENQKLINNKNCSEQEYEAQIKEILKKGEIVTNHYELLKTLDIEDKDIEQINELIDSFEYIKKKTEQEHLKQLEICEKKKNIDGKFKIVDELIKDKLYYKYDSKTKTVTPLGQYMQNKMYKFHHEAPLSVLTFKNGDESVEISSDNGPVIGELGFVVEPVEPLPGGKPRRTRRHKNKKRRSSKQQKSKK
jgi:hypothetical protein